MLSLHVLGKFMKYRFMYLCINKENTHEEQLVHEVDVFEQIVFYVRKEKGSKISLAYI